MTDESEIKSDSPSRESYRECSACGCKYHQSRDCCPECGAYPGEAHCPSADVKLNLTLSLLLGLILLIALFALSRDRAGAAAMEKEKFSRIKISEEGAPGEIEVPPPPVEHPTATPMPLPPTPTPLPRGVNPFKATPTPKPPPPAPKPTPVPQPTATPTPVPEPTRPSTLDLKDQLADSFRNELDSKMPLAKAGDYIRLTLRDNRTISGNITRLENNQLALQSTSGTRWIPFRQLSRESRMRVDKSERETWVEEQALQEVLKRLQN
ncbi:hypothetical protein P0Y35_00340 [Kiritimatiellaeota bacterium B1221]|nr:hypothetical protein [Kiritimatiellaeota bacterium B1221]